MRRFLHIFVVSICALITPSGMVHADPPGAPKPAPPAAPGENVLDKVVPDVAFDGVKLKDFLDFMSDAMGFQTVVVRDGNVPEDYPLVPTMKLRKVTLGQVLSILQEAYPNMEFHPIESEKGSPVYIFKIHDAGGAPPDQGLPAALRVYRLADVVEAVAARKAHGGPATRPSDPAATKAALDDVLSLIKAAVTQAGDGNAAPVIQVHEETLTLLLRGTPSQIFAVQSALEALTPPAVLAPMRERLTEVEHRLAMETAQKGEEIDRLKAESDKLRAELEAAQKSNRDHESMEERLKIRLEATLKSPPTKE